MSAGRSYSVIALLSLSTAASVGLSAAALSDAREARRETRELKERQREDHGQAMTFVKVLYDHQNGTDTVYEVRK